MRVHILGALLTLASALPAQTATFTTFGTGCGSRRGTPTFEPATSGRPLLGQTFVMQLTGMPVFGRSVIFPLIGGSRTSFNGQPLPLRLDGIGMPGCQLQVAPEFLDGPRIATGGGIYAWQLEIPNDPGLLGASLYVQMVIEDSAANALRLATSGGAEVRIGNR